MSTELANDRPVRIHEVLRDLLRDPARACILVGAGVSMRHPSMLPSGIELARATASAIDGELSNRLEYLATVKAHLAGEFDLHPLGSVPFPRPEIILEALQSVSDRNVAEALLFMQEATPNRNHQVLAALGGMGVRLFTTNFDMLIERCGPSSTVLHLHGSVEDLSDLRTTIQAVSRPLADDLKALFVDALEDCQLLVVLGYSGGDTFDVTPVLAEAGQRGKLWLLWLQHWRRDMQLIVDRGARKVLECWQDGNAELLPCDTDWVFDTLGEAIGCLPATATAPPGGRRGWWHNRLAEGLHRLLPRKRAVAALAVLEIIHTSRFFQHYAAHTRGGSLSPRHRLVLMRAWSRRECARGEYRIGKAVARRAVWRTLGWSLRRKVGRLQEDIYLADVVEQLLIYSMHMRVAGQHSLVEYWRSLAPSGLAAILLRLASSPSSDWRERKRFHMGVDTVQFLFMFRNAWVRQQGANLRTRLLKVSTWEAEHRARLVVSDPAEKGSAGAIDLHYDVESFGGLVNEARSSVRRALSSGKPIDRLEAQLRTIQRCYRVLGDIPGYFKTELLWAEALASIDVQAASEHLRKASWVLAKIRWPMLSRRHWRREIFRVDRVLKSARYQHS